MFALHFKHIVLFVSMFAEELPELLREIMTEAKKLTSAERYEKLQPVTGQAKINIFHCRTRYYRVRRVALWMSLKVFIDSRQQRSIMHRYALCAICLLTVLSVTENLVDLKGN